MQRLLFLPLAASLAAACNAYVGPASGEAPMRSPTLDYPLPDQQTVDGHAIGADRMRIEDKLETSPRVGTNGLTPAATPGPIERHGRDAGP